MTIKQLGGIFGRNPTFEDVTIEGTLTFDGDIDVNSDLKVAGDIETTGNVIIATSGKGIDFSATSGTGTSELFDDYEEGDYDVTLTPSTSGTITLGGSLNRCSYVKIGSLVTITGQLSVTSVSSPVGYININLPFTSADLADYSAWSAGSIIVRLSLGQNAGDFGIVVPEGSSTARIYLLDASEWQSDSAQAMKQYTNISIGLTYRSA